MIKLKRNQILLVTLREKQCVQVTSPQWLCSPLWNPFWGKMRMRENCQVKARHDVPLKSIIHLGPNAISLGSLQQMVLCKEKNRHSSFLYSTDSLKTYRIYRCRNYGLGLSMRLFTWASNHWQKCWLFLIEEHQEALCLLESEYFWNMCEVPIRCSHL